MKTGWGIALIAALAAASDAAAQPVGWQQIPDKVAGDWITGGAKCGSPSLAVAAAQPDGFHFRFAAPVKMDKLLIDGIPAPGIAGALPTASFEPPRDPAEKGPRLASGIEVKMPDANTMIVQFLGQRAPVTTYTRCGGAKVS